MKQKRGKKTVPPHTITKSVTHIRLVETNPGKLAALDQLAQVYLPLCQQYVTLFCTDELPNSFRAPCFQTLLSERWQRVAIQQAAGIAKSWRTKRTNASQDYLDALAEHQEQVTGGTLEAGAKEPYWREWDIPTLEHPCIQANANVVKLEAAHDSTFDYWLTISTLTFRQPLLVPVKLADYHMKTLTDPTTGKRRMINGSVTLNQREGAWWLTLSYDEVVTVQTPTNVPVIGIDVGIANFITTSDGKQYGTFNGKLRQRQKQDREKRRRKAKLRKCLEKKGVQKLPSTSSTSGQRLCRHIRQEINRAVNQCFTEHAGAQFAYEQLSVATMSYKARSMNAYIRASNLGHLPKQIAWNSLKRGVPATKVKSAYSSQECNMCHYVDRKNRPDQQTFCCKVCSHTTHADLNASRNIATRLHDVELRTCTNRSEIKALLMRRHELWKHQFRIVVVDPPVQLGLWANSQTSTDVG